MAYYSGIPILRTSKGNENWFKTSESSRNRGKITVFDLKERERVLVRVIGRFEKLRVREIGIPLYYFNSELACEGGARSEQI